MIEKRPTLLHSCAWAATAAEARFRVDYPNSKARATRVVALDDGAASVLGRLSTQSSPAAHLLTFVAPTERESGSQDARLRSFDGLETRLSEELDGADVTIMIATSGAGANAASVVGKASASRRIMTAGLALGTSHDLSHAVNALRPFAAVLVVSQDESFVPEMLVALRA